MKTLLRNQFHDVWLLTWYHLETLSTEECLWRPAAKGLHISKDDKGEWRGFFPESEAYDIGPSSIGWLSWHMLFWWEMTLNHTFGDQSLTPDQVTWPGTAEALRERLLNLKTKWTDALEQLSDEELNSKERCRWPFQGRPLSALFAWANMELTKNAAELGYARFLYTQRKVGQVVHN